MSIIFIVISEFTKVNWILAKNYIEFFSTKKILTINRLSVVSMVCVFDSLMFSKLKRTKYTYMHKILFFYSGKKLLSTFKHLHTYIIGHYNTSVGIIDLVSHTTYVVCFNFRHKWRRGLVRNVSAY